MGRILAIDFGTKRTGLAWTDELQISINPLTTLTPDDTILYIREHEGQLERIVLGMPSDALGGDTDSTESIRNFYNRLRNTFPNIPITLIDESYTSREARQYMIEKGYRKKDREKKENIDMFAAAFILQRYMDQYP